MSAGSQRELDNTPTPGPREPRAQPAARTGNPWPALKAVAAAGLVHLIAALTTLSLLRVDDTGGTRAAVIAVVLGTIGVALLTILGRVRDRHSEVDPRSGVRTRIVEGESQRAAKPLRRGERVARASVAAVFGLTPPLATMLALPLIMIAGLDPAPISPGAVAPPATALAQSIPYLIAVFTATTSSGVLIALALDHALDTLAARELGDARSGSSLSPLFSAPAPRLDRQLARLAAGLMLAGGLNVLAYALLHGADIQLWPSHAPTYIAGIGIGIGAFAVVAAATSAGRNLGRDLQTIATRLDSVGWGDERPADARHSALANPVRVTSFDTLGELFANLERLRARLAEDVGTYERALDRTLAADRAKGEFLAAVSHELRTPLNSIMGFAQLLLETELNESQAEDVRLILAGGRRLHELIADILDLSMIESGELDLRFEPQDLGCLVEELVELHQAQVRGSGVELRAEVEPELPKVSCDGRRIGQVLTNLLSNAIKFTEAGSVTVRVTRPKPEFVAIAVIDTGIGIGEQDLESVFEEYRQAGTRKRKLGGTGLGLAIARRMVEAHGGALRAQSTLGVGSSFRLDLPLQGRRSKGRPES